MVRKETGSRGTRTSQSDLFQKNIVFAIIELKEKRACRRPFIMDAIKKLPLEPSLLPQKHRKRKQTTPRRPTSSSPTINKHILELKQQLAHISQQKLIRRSLEDVKPH